MAKLEDSQVGQKPWMLTGEVSSKQRPLNSLLEATLDFEQATKAVPVVNEEVRDGIQLGREAALCRMGRARDSGVDFGQQDSVDAAAVPSSVAVAVAVTTRLIRIRHARSRGRGEGGSEKCESGCEARQLQDSLVADPHIGHSSI